jgi:hypothetical protein
MLGTGVLLYAAGDNGNAAETAGSKPFNGKNQAHKQRTMILSKIMEINITFSLKQY